MRLQQIRLLLVGSILLLYAQTLGFGFGDIYDGTYVNEVE